MIEIGFHTDAFNSSYWSFEQCLQWAQKNDVHWIECGMIDGVSWIHGLGYQPHVAMWEDPMMWQEKAASYGVQLLSDRCCLSVVLTRRRHAWVWNMSHERSAGHTWQDATISTPPMTALPRRDLTNDQALDMMKRSYGQIIEVAERYKMIIDIEPHGYYTTKPEFMEKMLAFVDSPYLRMNMDTGNTFIAGQDPVAFLNKFKHKVSHVHVKDVSESLAASLRGELTGIAVSQCAIGDGVNGENIKKCFDILVDMNYRRCRQPGMRRTGRTDDREKPGFLCVKSSNDANKRMAAK